MKIPNIAKVKKALNLTVNNPCMIEYITFVANSVSNQLIHTSLGKIKEIKKKTAFDFVLVSSKANALIVKTNYKEKTIKQRRIGNKKLIAQTLC